MVVMMTFQVQWYEQLASTNTFLREQAEREAGLPAGTVVAARRQTQGRGRQGRI